jgi:hypothetical protein
MISNSKLTSLDSCMCMAKQDNALIFHVDLSLSTMQSEND